MKRYFAGVSLAVLGLFLAYAAFGAEIRAVHADSGEDGGDSASVQFGAAANGVSVSAGADSSSGGDDRGQNDRMEKGQSGEVENNSTSSERGDGGLEMETEDDNVHSTSTLEASIKHRESELDAEASSTENDSEQEALKNQNEVRLAVHALLASKGLLGGIGPEVSQIAQNLNSSVTSTVAAEVKISSRGWFARFFFGGDKQSAQDILNQTDQNQQDIQKLNGLIASCTNCSPDLKTLLQDRLNVALAEQTRLQAVAKAEIDARGLFGILFGWLQK